MEHRTEQARRELGRTDVGRLTAAVMVAAFLLVLVGVAAWQTSAVGAPRSAPPGMGLRRAGALALEGRLFAGNRELHRELLAVERRLERESPLLEAALPGVQSLLSRLGHSASEEVVLGRDGWLLLRPALDHLTGPGFLSPRHRRARRDDDREAGADPVAAILGLAADLEARGVDLLVVPVPGKAQIHPQVATRLAPASRSSGPLENADFDAFVAALENAGVAVFDPAPTLSALSRQEIAGRPRAVYLETDSHWRPEAVEAVAEALAREVEALLGADTGHQVRRGPPRRIENRGDLMRLLRLKEGSPLDRRESVVLRPVLAPEGSTQRGARLLLLGDSFANVYSQAGLGWGSDAGLAELLSFHLQSPVERIAINAGGALSSRRELADRLARGEDPLAGKKLVIYQFAGRELSFGDWSLVGLDGASD